MTPPADGGVLREYLGSVTGFEVPEDRWRVIAPGLLARVALRGFQDDGSYVRYLKEDTFGRHELEELLSILTVRKTSFFRNPAAFEALARDVLPPVMAARERGKTPPAIWSAGCSTGEEPHSIAMVARSLSAGSARPTYLLATDIVTGALNRARRGVYPLESLAEIPERYRPLVSVEEGRIEIAESVRSSVEFHVHNLVRDPFPRPAAGAWDVIFCRNVLIYFGADTARRVIERFHECLAPGGALFLGHAEVLWGLESRFDVVFSGETFFYRKRIAGPDDATRRVPRPASIVVSRLSDTTTVPRRAIAGTETTREKRPTAPIPPLPPRPEPAPLPRREGTPTRPIPVLPFDLLARAESALSQGDTDGAARALRAAAAKAPTWAPVRLQLGRIYADRGETDQALAELEIAASSEPLEPRVHLLIGAVRERRNERDAAEAAYRKAVYLEPDFAAARYALAQIYRATSRTDRARRELRNVVRTLTSKPAPVAARFTDGVSPQALVDSCERELRELESGEPTT